jgi:hypothetical protein
MPKKGKKEADDAEASSNPFAQVHDNKCTVDRQNSLRPSMHSKLNSCKESILLELNIALIVFLGKFPSCDAI